MVLYRKVGCPRCNRTGYKGRVALYNDGIGFHPPAVIAGGGMYCRFINEGRLAIDAGYRNIDIDSSTLVDLSQPTLDLEQKENYTKAAELTALIRDLDQHVDDVEQLLFVIDRRFAPLAAEVAGTLRPALLVAPELARQQAAGQGAPDHHAHAEVLTHRRELVFDAAGGQRILQLQRTRRFPAAHLGQLGTTVLGELGGIGEPMVVAAEHHISAPAAASGAGAWLR